MAALESKPAAPRLALVDVLRGVAIVAMTAYHFAWDLAYLGFLYDITQDPRWIWFQRSILGSFLVLVGVGLVLGHGGPQGIRWRAFWRRWLILAAAAGAMSLTTWIAFGEAFAFFGILHAIALFSLMGLLFLRLPWWITAAVAAAVIALGATVKLDGFGERWLAWIGFWEIPPWTADLVSVFPWFGATLLGIALGGVVPPPSRGQAAHHEGLWGWQPRDPVTRGLRVLGRWSLLVYLLHQPVMLAVLYPLAGWLQPGTVVAETVSDPATFIAECRPACEASGSPTGYCTTYCDCAAEQIAAGDLWDVIAATEASPAVDQVIGLCRAMAERAN